MNDLLSDHERHDALLMAAAAAGDATERDADRANALLASCPDCRTLAADLRALSAAVHELPSPARPREFTLTPHDAARLRPSGWRRLWAGLRGDAFRVARPLGAGLASVGFAGLVFGSTVGGLTPPGDTTGSAGAPTAIEELAALPEGAGGSDGGMRGGAASPATLDAHQVTGQEEAGGPTRDSSGGGAAVSDGAGETAAATRPNEAMVVVSGSLFIVGIGLFGLRWTADRLGDG